MNNRIKEYIINEPMQNICVDVGKSLFSGAVVPTLREKKRSDHAILFTIHLTTNFSPTILLSDHFSHHIPLGPCTASPIPNSLSVSVGAILIPAQWKGKYFDKGTFPHWGKFSERSWKFQAKIFQKYSIKNRTNLVTALEDVDGSVQIYSAACTI